MYGLVAMVLSKRMRLTPVERAAIEQRLREFLPCATAETKKRCESLLASSA